MLSDKERECAEVPLDALKERARCEHASPYLTFKFSTDEDILGHEIRLLLGSFLDYMWEHAAADLGSRSNDTPNSDQRELAHMSICIGDTELLGLLGFCGHANGADILAKLRSMFEEPLEGPQDHARPKIVLRILRAPRACIDFHCHSSVTSLQIALNDPDEYSGAQRCFFVNNILHKFSCPGGSVCQHSPKVLHGVPALTADTCKSLLVVDQSRDLGEQGVVVVLAPCADVQGFIENLREAHDDRRQRVQMCCVCMENPSDHVLLPCGHVCLCCECVGHTRIGNCPICKGSVTSKHKIFL